MGPRTSFKLNTGATIPAIGLGTWQPDPKTAATAVPHGISVGYRHIDTAAIYMQETEVGNAVNNSKVPRSEFFVTSKLWNSEHDPKDVPVAFEKTLNKLGLDYIDLYLMHWPIEFEKDVNTGEVKMPIEVVAKNDFADTWRAMENLLETGKVKAIGVSNFTISNLKHLLASARVVPAVNQVELHPYLPQDELVEFCHSKGIHMTAYSPLGSQGAPLQSEPIIASIAEKHGCTPVQVLINWALARGTSVIPRSANPDRIKSNFVEVPLDDDDIKQIAEIKRRERYCVFPWTEGAFD
ncbi:NADP-dependent oxidoreductase domain-containing protein [Syncephalis fuscata]|nr:NADP-dependent oxidoreductase domain-containing protein [Syncephalis fuscata]